MTTEIRTPTATILTEYGMGQCVYLRARDEPTKGTVTAILIYPGEVVAYEVSWPDGCQRQYEFELSEEATL